MDRYSDGSNHWDRQPDGSFRPTPRRKQTQYTGQRPLFWKGTYDGSCYRPGDVVSDDGWLMTPNTPTCEKPAPTPIGSPVWSYQGADPTDQLTVKSLLYGHRYVYSTAGYVNGWRLWQVTGNAYTVYLASDPEGENVVEVLLPTREAQSDGWVEFNVAPKLLLAGTTFDLVAVVQEPDPSPTTFTGNWNYLTPNNVAVPTTGQVSHANQRSDSLRVHKTDNDGGDRSVELAVMTVGDIIEAGGTRWAVQTITDQGTWVEFIVAPATQISPDGVTSFIFETVTATPITYLNDPDYYLTNDDATGFLSLTGSPADVVADQDAYGVDIKYQQVSYSTDWDVMGAPSEGGTGGSTLPAELPSAEYYHDVTAKVVARGGTFADTSPQVDVNFTNPYPYPLRVQCSYVPHTYLFEAMTLYAKIVMSGAESNSVDHVEHIARRQYNGPSGTWYDQLNVFAVHTVPADSTVTFSVWAHQSAGRDVEFNYARLHIQALGRGAEA